MTRTEPLEVTNKFTRYLAAGRVASSPLVYFGGILLLYLLRFVPNIYLFKADFYLFNHYAPASFAKYSWQFVATIVRFVVVVDLTLYLIFLGTRFYNVSMADIGWKKPGKYWRIPLAISAAIGLIIAKHLAYSLYYSGTWHLVFAASYLWSRLHNPMAYYWLFIVPLASVIEELFYRGLIYTLLQKKINWILAVVVTSLLFTFSHTDGFVLVFNPWIFLAGLFYGLLRKWDDSIWVVVAAHFANNLVASWFVISP